MDIEMGFYVETICSGHRNGFLGGDHKQLAYKWAFTWRPYAVAIDMRFYVDTICSGHRNGFIRGDHMQWT